MNAPLPKSELWSALSALGPGGMFFVTAADTALLPTAQAVDVLIMARAARDPDSAWVLGLACLSGSLAGAMFLYVIARTGGNWALRKIISPKKLESVRGDIHRYGALALILPAMLPVPFAPMKILLFASGALGVKALPVVCAMAFARAARYFGLIYIGIYFGEEAWFAIRDNMWIVVAAAVVLAIVFFWRRRERSRRSAAAEAENAQRTGPGGDEANAASQPLTSGSSDGAKLRKI